MGAPPEPLQAQWPAFAGPLARCTEIIGTDVVDVAELPGGLTNRNYKVTTPAGAVVVRVSSLESGGLAIDRRAEYLNSLAAARSGAGPEVVGHLPDDGLLVVRFVEGTTLTDASFATPGRVGRVAEACRMLHSGPAFANDFDMFAVQARYLATVRANGYRLPAGYDDVAPEVEGIRRALRDDPVPSVPCNNDLLAGNFIDAGDRIWIIDYEYSGNNDPYFELGNIWSECHLDDDQLAELVEAYVGRPAPSRVARAKLQGLMSRHGWTLWASIQQAESTIDFDFWTWGLEKHEAAMAVFHGPELARLLDAVGRTDDRSAGA